MKKLAVAAAFLALAGPTSAADYAVRPAYTPPPFPSPTPIWDWSGIYIGVNGGGGWADETWGLPGGQFFTTAPLGAFAAFSTHPTGALAGGQIGINRQVGPWLFSLPWVFGVEFTGDWANLNQTRVGPLGFPNDVWTTKLTELETLTFRFGVPVNNWLFYGKVGGASGNIHLHALSGVPVAGVDFSNSQQIWGETIGAGIEYALTQNLILGAEYDFVRLFPGSFNGVGIPGGAARPVFVGANTPFDVQVVLGRLSYKFWPPTF
jgi:outer membrane immunogenic protein